jgi:ectoine hydroxylase-related dioxygenase (phytanoyl-CoA dioxygenase family)
MDTITPRTPRLTAEQVETYHREGWIVPSEPVFAPEKFEKLKAFFETLLDDIASDVRPEQMDVPHFQHPELFEWLHDDAVLDLVEPILGPDIALFSSHFICKPQGDGRRVPWHEDSAYWKGMLDPMEVVTVWLAIDPSTEENGCMYVVPRTHATGKHGFSDYDDISTEQAVFPTEITPTQRNDAAKVAVELQAGQASLHDGRIIHGSPPNTSSIRRCGYTMRYMSTRTKLNLEDFPWHQIYHARGEAHDVNQFADPTKAYHDLARYRSKHGKRVH